MVSSEEAFDFIMNYDEEQLKELIKKQEEVVREIDEWCNNEDFNPMDASGGNFDDAYQLGYEHGFENGKLYALRNVLDMFKNGGDKH